MLVKRRWDLAGRLEEQRERYAYGHGKHSTPCSLPKLTCVGQGREQVPKAVLAQVDDHLFALLQTPGILP
jgi:hypothetical protein